MYRCSFIFAALQFAQLKKIKRFVKHAEFQNMLYSNASRSLVDYYLITNDSQIDSVGRIVDLITASLNSKIADKQKILETFDVLVTCMDSVDEVEVVYAAPLVLSLISINLVVSVDEALAFVVDLACVSSLPQTTATCISFPSINSSSMTSE